MFLFSHLGDKRPNIFDNTEENRTRKRRRIDENADFFDIPTLDKLTKPTKFTDVNIDCLEKIFNYVDFVDLLNLADTCVPLRAGAALVFSLKHAKKNINLLNICSDRKYFVKKKDIQIGDGKSCLQSLRCFGNMITKLEISPSRNNHITGHIVDYVKEYCVDSLKEFKCEFVVQSRFEEAFAKPFSHVEKVEFNHCIVSSKILHFNEWFPQMTSLRLYGNYFVNSSTPEYALKQPQDYIEAHFPHLTQLQIVCSGGKPFDLTQANIEKVIDLNPQIKRLSLCFCPEMRVLQDISTKLPLLEWLYIRCDVIDYLNYTGDVIKFNSLKYLKMNFVQHYPMPEIPFLCNKIEEFNLYAFSEMNDELFEFLGNHPTIKKLTLRTSQIEINCAFKVKISQALPFLQEIDLYRSHLSMIDVVWILKNWPSLKIFHSFRLDRNDDIDTLPKFLDSKWEVQVVYKKYIKLVRKY